MANINVSFDYVMQSVKVSLNNRKQQFSLARTAIVVVHFFFSKHQ
jgi:hypothetical protein